jgi:hypothetical protein
VYAVICASAEPGSFRLYTHAQNVQSLSTFLLVAFLGPVKKSSGQKYSGVIVSLSGGAAEENFATAPIDIANK